MSEELKAMKKTLDAVDKAIRDLSLESVYAEGVANKALGDLGVIYRFLSRLEAREKQKPINADNPCGDCAHGTGLRPDDICDECSDDDDGIPSNWAPMETAE